MTPVQADDRLLDSLGSAVPGPPSNPNDWKLTGLLLQWRQRIDSRPMPAWVVG